MDRNLALEFVRVTEAAAIAAAKWLGRGDKNAADQAAVEEMRSRFQEIEFCGQVVIGEGEKDEAPMLFIGERVGKHACGTQESLKPLGHVEFDIAVDPLEGTTLTAQGRPGAISVIAFGPRGTFLNPLGSYMDQLTVGPAAKGVINILDPFEQNIKRVADACGKEPSELTIAILERERNEEYVRIAREAGTRVVLFDHGTVAHGLAPAISHWEIDMMAGIGGAPEGIITAAALKALGGDMQGVLKPHTPEFVKQARDRGLDLEKVYGLEDMCTDQTLFVATGVSPSPILRGVEFGRDIITTHSVVIRSKSGTVRFIETHHSAR